MNNIKILDQYNKEVKLFEEFRKKLELLVIELLKPENVYPHQITSRVKDYYSLSKKIEVKQNKYSDISEITDCVGIRIVTYLEDEVDIVAQIIEKEFDIDYINSTDKRNLDVDRFGYKSLHYIISLSDSRKRLPEYISYKNIKAEIQIRSILQHSWAEIEHDLGYKSAIVIPDIVKRDFYRVAALLETADIEFVKIKKTLEIYQNSIEKELEKTPSKFRIDKNTLESFVDKSSLINEINIAITKAVKIPTNTSYGDFNYVIEIFRKYDIKTIDDVNLNIEKLKNTIIAYVVEYINFSGVILSSTGKALAIHTLADILLFEHDESYYYPADEDISFEQARDIYRKIKEKS